MFWRQLFTHTIFGSLLLVTSADAHHNPASHYLMDQSITVEGVVTKFRLINPHIRLYFEVTTPGGEVQKWLGEGQAAAILKRAGWTRETLKAGDAIKITGHPARDGSYKLDWQSVELADGTRLGGGISEGEDSADTKYKGLEERRRRRSETE